MVVDCAAKMESGADPRTDISAIKVFVPAAYHRVVDRAIQVFGAKGVSGDLPLAGFYTRRAYIAHRRRAGRGAQDSYRQEHPAPLSRG